MQYNLSETTFDKARYNDDFGLFTNTESTFVKKGFFCPYDLVFDRDLSISFFIVQNNLASGTQRVISYTAPWNGPVTGGGITTLGTGTLSYLQNTSGGQFVFTLLSFNELVKNTLQNVVLDYNVTTNSFNVYLNSRFVRTVLLTVPLLSNSQSGFYKSYIPSTTVNNNNYLILDYAIINRHLTQQEKTEIYTRKYLPSSINSNDIDLYLPMNQIPQIPTKNKVFGKTANTHTWDCGAIFSDVIQAGQDGYVEFEILNTTSFTLVGLTDSTTNPTPSWDFPMMDYSIYADTAGNFQRSLSGSLLNLTIPRTKLDKIKVERINTLTTPSINFYINNVLVNTYSTSVLTGVLKPCVLMRRAFEFAVKNVRLNGVQINNIQDSQNVNNGLCLNDVSGNNNHAFLLGWSDEELGIDYENVGFSKDLAFSNFYTKKNSDIKALRMDGKWINKTSNHSYFKVPTLTGSDFSNGYSIVIEGDLSSINGSVPSPFWNSTSPQNLISITGSSIVFQVNGNAYLYVIPIEERKKIYSIVITANVSGEHKLFLNGTLRQTITQTFSALPLSNNLFGVTGDNRYYKYHEGFYIFDKVLSNTEILNNYKDSKKWIALLPRVAYCMKFSGNNLVNESTFAYANTTTTGNILNAKNIVDVNTQKRPVKYGLYFDGTGTNYLEIPDFNPTKEKGYTIVCAFKDDNSPTTFTTVLGKGVFPEPSFAITYGTNTPIMDVENSYPISNTSLLGMQSSSFYPNLKRTDIIFNVLKVSPNVNIHEREKRVCSQVTLQNSYKKDFSQTDYPLFKGFNELSGSFLIGKHPNYSTFEFKGTLLYLAIFKGTLCDEECKRLHNNGLFMNPWDISPITQSELVFYPDFNNPFVTGTGDFNNDFNDDFSTGSVQIPDLSPSNYTILANGWSNLTSFGNSRIELNSLR